jgi:hypothetical protein
MLEASTMQRLHAQRKSQLAQIHKNSATYMCCYDVYTMFTGNKVKQKFHLLGYDMCSP